MFKKDRNVDVVKKSSAKVLDVKRDSHNRLKHLRNFLDHVDNQEAKEFFQNHYSVVYFVFHDAFSMVEANIRNKGVHKSQREEFDSVKYIFEKILTLLPELIAEGWQSHSIRIIMKKILHMANSYRVLCEGVRLFLIWYQILRESAPVEVDHMFQHLVPGIVPSMSRPTSPVLTESATFKDSTFYTTIDNEVGPVVAGEHGCLFPSMPGDIQPENIPAALLELMLTYMVTQITKIQWSRLVVNGVRQYERCFSFLLDRFRAVYLPHIFPNMSTKYSVYTPNLDLPAAVRSDSVLLSKSQSVVVMFLVQYVTPLKDEREAGATRNAMRMDTSMTFYVAKVAWSPYVDDDILRMVPSLADTDLLTVMQRAIVRNVLFATPANVDFVHELFRQTLVSPLGQTQTTKKVIAVYREWIHMTYPDPPTFLIEQPMSDQPRNAVFCGQQNLYKVFITNASNFFLLSLPVSEEKLLEEQVDLCKRVMNIYRFMVMKKLMERGTWEQLLYVILHVTSQVLTNDVPRKQGESLGMQLAPALFQTLIVTWIKANLHATICVDLWNGFVRVLSTLAHWGPLVDEWAKTMKTLTRILTTRVYGLDLDNLPLDRLSEQQSKRRRALKPTARQNPDSNVAKNQTPRGGQGNIDPDSKTEKCVRDGMTQSSTTNFCGLQRRLSDSHLYTHKRLDWRNRRLTSSHLSKSFPQMNNLNDCALHCESANTSPAASSSALESTSMKDHQLTQMMDCASSDNAALPGHMVAEMLHRSGSNASEYASHRASVSSRFDLIRCDSQSEATLAAETSMLNGDEMEAKDQQSQEEKDEDGGGGGDGGEGRQNDEGESNDPDARSVLAGGTQKGWCPEVAVVLWRRMVCSLGNVNNIKDPHIHGKVMDQVAQLCETLIKVRENQGVTEDNLSSPTPPQFIPPIHMLTPWFFDATLLSSDYEKGKLISYNLLCELAFRCNDIPLTSEFVTRLYDVLHKGLTGGSQKVKNAIVKASGTRFFGTLLPGFSLLILDYIKAAGDILGQETLKGMPRAEAVMTLGAQLFLPSVYGSLQTLDPTYPEGFRLIPMVDTNCLIMEKLIHAARCDPDWQARCTAICAISVYCYQQLLYKTYHKYLVPSIIALLQSLKPCMPQNQAAHLHKGVKFSKCHQYTVCQMAAECLSLLSEFTDDMMKDMPEVPSVILRSIASVLSDIYPPNNASQDVNEGFANLVISLIFCLAEWAMKIPLEELTRPQGSGPSCLHAALNALDAIVKGVKYDNKLDLTVLYEKICPNGVASTYSTPVGSPLEPKLHQPLTASFSDPQNESRHHSEHKSSVAIKLAAKAMLCHLLNNIAHFPMNSVSLTNTSSLTVENDDVPGLSDAPELNKSTFAAPNIQFFTVNNNSIVSLVEIPPNDKSSELTTGKARTRVIVRDLCGKFSWDCLTLYGPAGCRAGSFPPGPSPDPCMYYSQPQRSAPPMQGPAAPCPPKGEHDSGPQNVYPTATGEEDSRDNLNKLIGYIGSTSPECATQQPLNCAPRALSQQSSLMEADQINEILSQSEGEAEEVARLQWSPEQRGTPLMPPQETGSQQNLAPFQYSRLLLDQLNFLTWERRNTIALLQKNEKLLRELRYLDQQRSRETHKIAVIYVAAGQEDKNSILMNQNGSPEFENFVQGLGWDIDLRSHTGYRGGLDWNGSTGHTAPYYANSFIEVLFHVSTRIPAQEKDAMTKKLRHLGNDEVHVVWSEHQREYRRGIIATEFGDVFIVLYPMPDGLCRVQINAKPDVPFFGPLFDGAIVDQKVLPALVRATAINADRAVNSLKLMFRNFYEVRCNLIDNVCANFKEPTTFEEFACKVFSPSAPKSPKSTSMSKTSDGAADSTGLDGTPIKTRTGSTNEAPSSPLAPPRLHRDRPLSHGPVLQHSQSSV